MVRNPVARFGLTARPVNSNCAPEEGYSLQRLSAKC